jgi:hypothetical protein
MSGVTGSDGALTFLMSEVVGYTMTFTDTERGISETRQIYPAESVYQIRLGAMFADQRTDQVNITLWSSTNEANMTVYGYYDDPNLHTTNLTFVVRYQNGTVVNAQALGAVNTANTSYALAHVTGGQYLYGYEATQTDYGTVQKYAPVTMHSRLIDLGLEEGWYYWISLSLIFVFAAMWSGINTKYGLVLLPLWVGLLWYIGWFAINPLLLSFAIILGILAYIIRQQGV